MSGRFDIARALAATATTGHRNKSRSLPEARTLETLLKKQSSRPKKDPEACQSQSGRKRRQSKPPIEDDDEGNPLPSLEVDQLLDFLSVVGTGVLEGHQAGSIKPVTPKPSKKPKQTRSIDAPTSDRDLQTILKDLEQKKAAAETQEEIVRALLDGANGGTVPKESLPSPEQLTKLVESVTAAQTKQPKASATPVTPQDIVKKLVTDGVSSAPALPSLDAPEVKVLKDIISRQQGELEKLRGMVKQALDHTDELKETHKKHSLQQEKEIERLKGLLKKHQEKKTVQAQESLAEQLRRKFASRNPTLSPQRERRYEAASSRTAPLRNPEESPRRIRYEDPSRRMIARRNVEEQPVPTRYEEPSRRRVSYHHHNAEEEPRSSRYEYIHPRSRISYRHPDDQARRNRYDYTAKRVMPITRNPHSHPRSSYGVASETPTDEPQPRSDRMECGDESPPAVEATKTAVEGGVPILPDCHQSLNKRPCVQQKEKAEPCGPENVIDLSNDDGDLSGSEEESEASETAEEPHDADKALAQPKATAEATQEKDSETACLQAETAKEPERAKESDAASWQSEKALEPPQANVSEGTEAAEEPTKAKDCDETSSACLEASKEEETCPLKEQRGSNLMKAADEEPTDSEEQGRMSVFVSADVTEESELVEEDESNQHHDRTPIFIKNLHEALEDLEAEGHSDIASFLEDGTAFGIHKPEKFAEHAMERFFPTISYASFQRQLLSYDFRRIDQGPNCGAYYHRFFIKGDTDKAMLIKRDVRKGLLSQKLKQKRDAPILPPVNDVPPRRNIEEIKPFSSVSVSPVPPLENNEESESDAHSIKVIHVPAKLDDDVPALDKPERGNEVSESSSHEGEADFDADAIVWV